MKNVAPILAHLQRTRVKFIDAAAAIPEERWRESPGAGRWSAGEVVAHVMMVEHTIISRASKLLKNPPSNVPFLRRFHLPPVLAAWRGMKRKTPIPLDPALVSEKSAALELLSADRRTTIEFIESTRGRDLHAYRFPHPFMGSLNIYGWLRLIAYHDLRHAKQIREIVQTFHH